LHRFIPGSVYVGFVMDKVALGQVSFKFSLQYHAVLLHIHACVRVVQMKTAKVKRKFFIHAFDKIVIYFSK
jgi:hypothetical protein